LRLGFWPSDAGPSDAFAERIFRKLIEFPQAMFHALTTATEKPGNIAHASVAELHRFCGGIPPAIFFGEAAVNMTHFLFHLCLVHFPEFRGHSMTPQSLDSART
jgi:hypothetical protein